MAERAVLGKQGQNAVLYLLNYVWNAIGPANLHKMRILVHGGLIPVDMKRFASEDEIGDDARLSLGADVVVTRVVPTSHIQVGNMLTGGERRVGSRSHRIAVEVGVVQRRLARVIHM